LKRFANSRDTFITMKAFTARFLLTISALIGLFLFSSVVARAASATVSAGHLVTLSATADGTAPFTYQWYKDSTALSGATDSSYTLSSFQAADAGTYTAVVSNDAGSTTSDGAVLTLAIANVGPVFTTQPSSQTVTAGGAVTFTAAASGTPAPTFQWQKSGVNISGATSASYALSSTTTGDAGSYTVVATNSVSPVTSNAATLTVNPAPVAPVITTQPSTQTVTAGNSVTFTAAASGIPAPTYQWKKNGTSITGATSSSYTLASVTTGNAGSYTFVATNSAGSATSSTATLTVNPANTAPVITTQPSSQTVTVGGGVTFTAAASGTPAPTYQWKKAGVNISGATSASYSIASATSGNAGSYTVVATNSVGAATSNAATLTVNPAPAAPVFTTQPSNQKVKQGSSVTFTAVASGTPAPTFQWTKDGVTISGATSATYTIPVAATTDEASYAVIASNTMGAATSDAAVLSVTTPPKNARLTIVVK
jgi:plastocyanin